METHVYVISEKMGADGKKIFWGPKNLKRSGNNTFWSENMNENVLLSIFLLIIIIIHVPSYVNK